MPRPDPRQRLLRDALASGVGGGLVVAAAAWWAIRLPPPAAPLGDQTHASASRSAPVPPPTAALWRPVSDTPVAVAAPPPPPAMRLISLSHRDARWVALVDPGDGSGAQRVSGGEQIAGWQVDSVTPDSVELSAAGRHHQLRFTP